MKQVTCDRCGVNPAISEAVFSTSTTTPIKMDLCEPCFADVKKIFRSFTKQDVVELDAVVAEAEANLDKVKSAVGS